MHRKALTIAVCALLVSGAREASAQTLPLQDWIDRGYFNFNVGFESTSGTLNDAVTLRVLATSYAMLTLGTAGPRDLAEPPTVAWTMSCSLPIARAKDWLSTSHP